MPRGSAHTHKYFRVNASKKGTWIVFRCALPKCNHYLQEAFISGKECICWGCSGHFIVGRHNKDQVKLKCAACTHRSVPGKIPQAKPPAAVVTGGIPGDVDVDVDGAVDDLIAKLGAKGE